jgi:hypothetical protein
MDLVDEFYAAARAELVRLIRPMVKEMLREVQFVDRDRKSWQSSYGPKQQFYIKRR